VRLLIEKGANLEAETNGGEMALQKAAGNGHEVVVRQLLRHNGNDASYKKWIATARLYQASMDSDAAAMQQLIHDGADIKVKDIGGETALDRAAHFKYVAVMQVLLQSEVDASVEEWCYHETISASECVPFCPGKV
jgi:ankyrin repeat protein